MLTVNNKDTGTTPLASFLILNSFHSWFLRLSSLLWTGSSLIEWMISQTKPLKIKPFLTFNFSITNICVAILLADRILFIYLFIYFAFILSKLKFGFYKSHIYGLFAPVKNTFSNKYNWINTNNESNH